MKDFLKTTAGRMLAFAAALALIGGGAAALVHEPMATWVLALLFPTVIAIGYVAVAFASTDSWGAAIACAIALPWILFVYAIGLGVVVSYAPQAGAAFVVLGAGLLAFAVRPRERAEAPQTAGSLASTRVRA